jgi:imidazolonepropionase-like amidohydrolase
MRTQRSLLFPASTLLAVCCLSLSPSLAAQEPTPVPAPATQDPPATQPQDPAATAPPADGRRGTGRQRRAPIVLEAGTVHPVSGPAIQDGVVVIRGDRIVAVGKKGEVEVPPNATVRSFPTGHIYPGLVDAATDAFTDDSLRGDGGNDGGSRFADDLRKQGNRTDELVAAGITTAYVTVRSPALVRGQGAIVRPTKDGFETWSGKEAAGLEVRLTNGLGPSHALQRQQHAAQVDGLFEGLDDFRKQKTDHDEAVKKYDKEFADYLAWHQKKKDGDKPAEGGNAGPGTGAPAGAGPGAGGPGPGREGRPGGRPRPQPGGGGGNEPPKNEPPKLPGDGVSDAELEAALATLLAALPQDPPKPQPTPAPTPTQEPGKQDPQKPAGEAAQPAAEKKDEAPKRPTYPKAPAPDPQREALLKVVDGDLPLRVEAHRKDEIRAALKLARDRQIPVLVLGQAYGADACANDLATAGVSVVLTETLGPAFDAPYDTLTPARVPARLHAASVPFALASGRAAMAPLLPLAAATAVGNGLPEDAALRALTLTPAEILGVAADTGSLQAGKFGDVLVTDRPLLATDSRVLLVLGKGRIEYEAK